MTFRTLAFLSSLICLTAAASAQTAVKQLAPGITLTQEVDQKPPLIINILTVDLHAPGVRLGVDIGLGRVNGPEGTGGRENVDTAAQRHGALAAVNGDFFAGPAGDPLGVGIKNGTLFSEPWWGDGKAGPRPAMAVVDQGHRVIFSKLGFLGDLQTADGARAAIAGVDRKTGPNEMIVYTSLYGPVTGNRPQGTDVVLTGVNQPLRANKLMTGTVVSVIPDAKVQQKISPHQVILCGAPGTSANFLTEHVKPGQQIEFVLAVAPPDALAQAVQIAELPRTAAGLPSRSGALLDRPAWLWGTTQNALGGGPRLLRDGQVTVDGAAEGFDFWFVNSRQPRTAVGTTKGGGHLLIATVDGRQTLSQGVTLPEMAMILKKYGAWNAISLDGGASTAMAAAGVVVSSPGGMGTGRRVAETLEVFSSRGQADPQPAPAQMQLIIPADNTVTQGSETPIKLKDGTQTIDGNAPDVLWKGPVPGVGFMDQKGVFHAVKPGAGEIAAVYQGFLVTGKVTVAGKPPAPSPETLSAEFVPHGAANYTQLTIHISDQTGKPLANALIHLAVTGGIADSTDVITSEDGYVQTGITWSQTTGGSVIVSSAGLHPVKLEQP